MADPFDLLVIGAGPGGYVAALHAAQQGARVAIVEKGHLGGTCLNFGCIPSKALLASAQLIHEIRQADKLGITVTGEISCDWLAVQKRKDRVLTNLRGGINNLFKSRKIQLIQGTAQLDGPGRVTITPQGPASTITARKIILAVGSEPARIPGWPEDPKLVCTSDQALHWKDLPKRLLIVGGGVIGCEFACMMQALGVQVTIVELLPRLLPEMDGELAAAMTKIFKDRQITCHLGVKVQDVTLVDGQVKATLNQGTVIEADRILLAVGRRPATASLGLASVGLTADRGFVRVDDQMQTSVKDIYCIGDANGRCLLAHAASAQAVVAADNALGHQRKLTAPMPWAVYSFPEIAGVGLTEEKALEQKLPISVGNFPIGHLGKAMAVNHTTGFVKVIRHRETDQILGVHMLGHNVTEIIASAAALIGQKATVSALADTVFAHPTLSEALKESAEDALGHALHLPPRKVMQLTAGCE